jgi:hypothetical protein
VLAGYFDYISHREWVPLLLMGGAAVGAILYRHAIYAPMRPLNQLIPERWFPVLLAGLPATGTVNALGRDITSSSGVRSTCPLISRGSMSRRSRPATCPAASARRS